GGGEGAALFSDWLPPSLRGPHSPRTRRRGVKEKRRPRGRDRMRKYYREQKQKQKQSRKQSRERDRERSGFLSPRFIPCTQPIGFSPMTGGLAKRLCKPLAAVTHLILLAASGARSQVPHRAAAPSAVAAATPRARVYADPAAAPAPAAPPNAWSSRGAAAAPPLRTVDAALCKPFLVEGLFVSGCTEIDSPRGAEPWCAVGNERVLCDRRSIPARSARLPDGSGDPVPCDPSTVVAGRGAVYGCFATEDGSPVMCKSGKRGLLPCISLKAQGERERGREREREREGLWRPAPGEG
ncbi:MAG: hypothetical protein BJ554DRAFT_4603, partial [Olpidium bornovanus]